MQNRLSSASLIAACYRAFAILVLAASSGCATTKNPIDAGVEHYRRGEYDQAATLWNPLAQAGNPIAEHNLGLLWEYGHGRTPKNPNQASLWYLRSAKQGYVPAMSKLARIQMQAGHEKAAVSWATLAARWGDQSARRLLWGWDKPIPEPDLYRQRIARQERMDQERVAQQERMDRENANFLLFMGASFLSGMASGVAEGLKQSNSEPFALEPLRGGQTAPSAASRARPSGCTADYECGVGMKCAKPLFQATGVCLQTVNEYGTPVPSLPSPSSVGPRATPDCLIVTDCPPGFRCDANLQMCVR